MVNLLHNILHKLVRKYANTLHRCYIFIHVYAVDLGKDNPLRYNLIHELSVFVSTSLVLKSRR